MNLRERPFYLTDAQVTWVSDTLSSMALEEKVGQLFLVMGQDYAPKTLCAMVCGLREAFPGRRRRLPRPAPASDL